MRDTAELRGLEQRWQGCKSKMLPSSVAQDSGELRLKLSRVLKKARSTTIASRRHWGETGKKKLRETSGGKGPNTGYRWRAVSVSLGCIFRGSSLLAETRATRGFG